MIKIIISIFIPILLTGQCLKQDLECKIKQVDYSYQEFIKLNNNLIKESNNLTDTKIKEFIEKYKKLISNNLNKANIQKYKQTNDLNVSKSSEKISDLPRKDILFDAIVELFEHLQELESLQEELLESLNELHSRIDKGIFYRENNIENKEKEILFNNYMFKYKNRIQYMDKHLKQFISIKQQIDKLINSLNYNKKVYYNSTKYLLSIGNLLIKAMVIEGRLKSLSSFIKLEKDNNYLNKESQSLTNIRQVMNNYIYSIKEYNKNYNKFNDKNKNLNQKLSLTINLLDDYCNSKNYSSCILLKYLKSKNEELEFLNMRK